jgi:hypothetical protein
MAAVNEAWRVLGDPGRRRQYDRQQAGAAVPPRPSPPPSTQPEPEFDGPVEAEGDVVTKALRGAPLVAILLVLLAIFIVSAFAAQGARSPRNNGADDGVVEVGSCVSVATGVPVVEVPCSEAHDGRAAAVVPLDLPCPANTDYYVAPGGDARVCVRMERTP